MNTPKGKYSIVSVLKLFSETETETLSFLEIERLLRAETENEVISDLAMRINDMVNVGVLSVSDGKYSLTDVGMLTLASLMLMEKKVTIPTPRKSRRYAYDSSKEDNWGIKPLRRNQWNDIVYGRD